LEDEESGAGELGVLDGVGAVCTWGFEPNDVFGALEELFAGDVDSPGVLAVFREVDIG
jgi:hypothetical protein